MPSDFTDLDEAIILHIKPHREIDLLVKLLTKKNGLIHSYVAAGSARKNMAIYQRGNIINAEISKRNIHQIGFLKADVKKTLWAVYGRSPLRSAVLSSLWDVLLHCLPEACFDEGLYDKLSQFLNHSLPLPLCELMRNYIFLLFEILSDLGYGPDIYQCCVTGATDNLAFISPKTGRAVTYDTGLAYQKKLLILPTFIIKDSHPIPDKKAIKQGLSLIIFFYEKYIFHTRNKNMPDIFNRLYSIL